MPFTNQPSRVTVLLEQRRQRCSSCWKPPRRITGYGTKWPFDAVALLVLAGNKSCPGWRAVGAVGVCIGKAESSVCQAVEVWRSRITHPVTADVAVTEIVHKDQNDVWLCSSARTGLRRAR